MLQYFLKHLVEKCFFSLKTLISDEPKKIRKRENRRYKKN